MSLRSISIARALGVAVLVALLSSAAVAGSRLRTTAAASCGPVSPTAAGRIALARGGAIVSGVGTSIVSRVSGAGAVATQAPLPGLARHFASAPRLGTAYVVDRAGPDRLVVIGSAGVDVIAEPGEATHPAWSPDGRLVWSLGSELRLRSADGTRIRSIAPPRAADAVFSPLFLSATTLVAAVAERTTGPHSDTALDNLWAYDLARAAWRRLTDFTAAGDRWSAVRTPVLSPRGGVEFVRVRGVGSRAGSVGYELWSWSAAGPVELRSLPEERYLAGFDGARRLWNRYDLVAGEWRLLLEGADGSLRDLGCGRVQVDPRGRSDPDLGFGASPGPPGPSPTPTVELPSATPSPGDEVPPSMAILVGDFSSADAAEGVAARFRETYGDAAMVAVVDNARAPLAVAPGVWAVVLPVAAGADLAAELEAFRASFPEYAGWSWVVAI
ncbi:MAG: hypothetical protein U0V56_12690 [Actinomycetota bacterium]